MEQLRNNGKTPDKANEVNNGSLNVGGNVPQRTSVIKSPSDSTIYTPALRQCRVNENAIDQISDFVDNIRLQSKQQNIQRTPNWDNRALD